LLKKKNSGGRSSCEKVILKKGSGGSFHCSLVSISFFSFAWGLDYPTKPINLVTSASAGGPSDLHARILGEAASKELGVPVVVVNKPGPGGALGASFVANEKPDGYTYLATQSGTMTSKTMLVESLHGSGRSVGKSYVQEYRKRRKEMIGLIKLVN
jgi:hypothetical protein